MFVYSCLLDIQCFILFISFIYLHIVFFSSLLLTYWSVHRWHPVDLPEVMPCGWISGKGTGTIRSQGTEDFTMDVALGSRSVASYYSYFSFHFNFISKPRVSDTWAWHTIALLALCETKRSRQDFPLFQVGKQGLVKISTPDHIGIVSEYIINRLINVSSFWFCFLLEREVCKSLLEQNVYRGADRQQSHVNRIENELPRGEWKSTHAKTSLAHSKLDIVWSWHL